MGVILGNKDYFTFFENIFEACAFGCLFPDNKDAEGDEQQDDYCI
jgi:hypothetical protein